MKESIGRIQQDGYSKPLLELVKRWQIQKSCVEYIKKDNEHSFFSLFNHNELCCYHEGLVEESSAVLLELCFDRVVEVNTNSHELLKVNGEEVKGIEHNVMLSLNDDGERWEGDVLNREPYGWGVLYDSEGEKKYEGFMIGDVNVCYGTRYYSDIQKVEYEGEWCEGRRWGRGVQFDRNGSKVFDGEWVNDEQLSKRVVLNEENQCLHNHIEELVVSDSSCNGPEWNVLDLRVLIKLKELTVGDLCFKHVKEVLLVGLKQLETVVIGGGCFTEHENDQLDDIKPYGHFYLKDCGRVRELTIGCGSFSDYSVCEIENVDSLEVIEMGNVDEDSCNFYHASLELKSDSHRME